MVVVSDREPEALGRQTYGPAPLRRQDAGRQQEESAEPAHDVVTVTGRARDGDKFRRELRNGPAHSPPMFKRGPVPRPFACRMAEGEMVGGRDVQ